MSSPWMSLLLLLYDVIMITFYDVIMMSSYKVCVVGCGLMSVMSHDVFQVFHKIITSGLPRLQPLYDCLLTVLVNGK